MKDKKKEKVFPKYKNVFLIAIFIATLLMSIGYASINNITLDLTGRTSLVGTTGVFIYEANINQAANADVNSSQIQLFYQTMLRSKVALLTDNLNSTLPITITVYNKSANDVYFDDVIYTSEFYDNNNIDYTLSGISHNQKLAKNASVTFTITFKYKDTYKNSNPAQPYSNILNSYLNFRFLKGYDITYSNMSNTSSYPSVVLEGNNLVVHFAGDVPVNLRVEGVNTNTTYVSGTDYTYSNGTLTFNNVQEPLNVVKISSGSGGEAGTVVTNNPDGSTTTVTTEDDGFGNVIVTEFDVDTSNTQTGSITVPTGGIDSGVLAFDGHDFDVTLTAKYTFSNVDPSSINPVLDLSIYENGVVNGFLIMVASNYGGTSYNESGTSFSSNSSNRYIKFRFNKYTNGTLDSNNRDYYYSGGNTPFYSNRFATQSSTITLTLKVYCRSGQFTSDLIYNNNIIAKPRYSSANNPYVFTFNNAVGDATIKVGTWTNNSGNTYTSNFEIIDFHVSKTIN